MKKKWDLGYGNGSLLARGKNWYYRFLNENGKWVVSVIKDDDGKSVQDKKEAYEIIVKQLEKRFFVKRLNNEQVELQIERNKRIITKHNFKISEIWERYESNLNRPDSGKETMRSYRDSCKLFFRWLNNNYPNITEIDEINEALAGEFLTHYANTRVTNRSWNVRLQALNLIFKTLLNDDNPFRKFKAKKLNTQSYKPFTVDQVNNILKILDSDYYMLNKSEMKTLVYVSLYTGCRLGDASLMKWEYIDFENNIITFTPVKTKRNGRAVSIPINNALLSELKKHRDNDSEYVLSSVSSRYFNNPTGISKDIKKLLIASEIEDSPMFSFHSFRHTFVTLAMNNGFGIETVKSIVGHSSIAMTGHYTKIDMANKQKVLSSMPTFGKHKVDTKQISKEDLILNLIKKLTKDKSIIKEAEEILGS